METKVELNIGVMITLDQLAEIQARVKHLDELKRIGSDHPAGRKNYDKMLKIAKVSEVSYRNIAVYGHLFESLAYLVKDIARDPQDRPILLGCKEYTHNEIPVD